MKPVKPHLDAVASADLLAALADEVRLRICRLLECQELSVGEVARVFQGAQSSMSRHLSALHEAGWVQRRAAGTATLYRLSPDDLPAPAMPIWAAIRPQVIADPAAAEDDRRLASVLAERTADTKTFFGRVGGEWAEIRRELFGRHFTAGGLLALLPRGWVVADLGCGTGDAAEVLADHVKQVIAVDQSPEMLHAGRARLGHRSNVAFLEGSLESLPMKDRSVDAAVALLVMHHVSDPRAALREMWRVIRPGGRVLILDMVAHDRDEYRTTMGHAHLGFDAQGIEDLLHGGGFVSPRVTLLPPAPEGKGPGLFVASADRTND